MILITLFTTTNYYYYYQKYSGIISFKTEGINASKQCEILRFSTSNPSQFDYFLYASNATYYTCGEPANIKICATLTCGCGISIPLISSASHLLRF